MMNSVSILPLTCIHLLQKLNIKRKFTKTTFSNEKNNKHDEKKKLQNDEKKKLQNDEKNDEKSEMKNKGKRIIKKEVKKEAKKENKYFIKAKNDKDDESKKSLLSNNIIKPALNSDALSSPVINNIEVKTRLDYSDSKQATYRNQLNELS